MQPLDLTKTPPRGPREKMVGLYFLPRTIDKIRAELPGGESGSYFVANPAGMSAYVLRKIGIELAPLRAVVASAEKESDVAAWILAHADLSDIDRLNASIASVTLDSLPPERRTVFNDFYAGAAEMPGELRLFDVFELDDAQLIR